MFKILIILTTLKLVLTKKPHIIVIVADDLVSLGKILIFRNRCSALCGICPNPHKSIELQFSKNYLTTKDPSLVRIQKIQKFRKIYSPDPDSGSGIPEI